MATIIKQFVEIDLNNYFNDTLKGHYYEQANKKRKEFLPHSDKAEPIDLIKKQRPNEPEYVMQFRLDIWQPITNPTFTRLISSLSKIRRSSEWAINYPNEKFNRVRDDETLNEYCEKNYPYFGSITNWIFGVLLKQYLIDPNAVVLVMPLSIDIQPNEHLKPFTYIYESCDVIDYEDSNFAILKISSGCFYNDDKGTTKKGKSFYVVTNTLIDRWDQIDDKGNMAITWTFEHNLNFLPAFKLKAVICNSNHNDFLYESRINGVLPNLNEAICEYTDLQAAKRLHIYPERWEHSQHECTKCRGKGLLINTHWQPGDDIRSREIKCPDCINGYIPSGPYSKIIVRPVSVDQQPIPNPPAGYIEKDVEIVKIMDESVDKHIYKALSAINFQFLEQVPLNESGIAKEVDKEELNNTVHSIAEDIIAIMDNIYKTIAYYRYSIQYPQNEIDKMLPSIPVPEHFDLINSQYMQAEIKAARDAKINPLLISQMEVEYTERRFSQNIDLIKLIKLITTLDPLPGYTEEDKMSMKSNGGITNENYIISSNIINFILRALDEDDKFDELEYSEQKEVLKSYAQEQIEEANKNIVDVQNDNKDDVNEEEQIIEEPEIVS